MALVFPTVFSDPTCSGTAPAPEITDDWMRGIAPAKTCIRNPAFAPVREDLPHVIDTGLDPIIAPPPTRRETDEFFGAWREGEPEKPHIRLDTPDENRPMWLMYRCSLRGQQDSGWGFDAKEAFDRWDRLTRALP